MITISVEEFKKKLDESPDVCLITGLRKCTSYLIDGQVVYLTNPAYDAYTLASYDEQERTFSHIHYDMDDDNRMEVVEICSLDELEEMKHPRLEEIKAFYNIQ